MRTNKINETVIISRTIKGALISGSRKLGLKLNEVDYKILKEEKKKFFKLNKKAILVYKKEPIADPDGDNHNDKRDGYFKINYKDGYAYLSVFPPKPFGREVYSDEIINKLKLLNIHGTNLLELDKIIIESGGKPVRFARWPEERI